MVVLKKVMILFSTEYLKVDSLIDIKDQLKYIGSDDKHDIYMGKMDDLYYVPKEKKTNEES